MRNTKKRKSSEEMKNTGTDYKNIFRHIRDITVDNLGYKPMLTGSNKTMNLIKLACVAFSLLLIYPVLTLATFSDTNVVANPRLKKEIEKDDTRK